MQNIANLFRDIHGPIDFNKVQPWKDSDKTSALLKVDKKYLYHNPSSFLDKYFYFDGIYYANISPDSFPFLSENMLQTIINGFKKSILHFATLVKNEEYVQLFDIVDKKVLIKVYTDLYDKIPDFQKWEAYINLHIRSEYGFDLIPQTILDDLIAKQVYNSKERPERLQGLKIKIKNKDTFVVYHGINGNYDPKDEMSWTLSKKVASFFAERFGNKGKVVKKTINFDEVIDFFNHRNEEEILLKIK